MRRVERRAAAAHRRVEPSAAGQQHNREREAEDERDDQRMQRQRIGVGAAAGAERARDRRRNAAAHGAGRHHLHQHQQRKHQRDAGERIGAELADEIGLDQADRRTAPASPACSARRAGSASRQSVLRSARGCAGRSGLFSGALAAAAAGSGSAAATLGADIRSLPSLPMRSIEPAAYRSIYTYIKPHASKDDDAADLTNPAGCNCLALRQASPPCHAIL